MENEDIALLLRQRAYALREGRIGNESNPGYAGNLPAARELESIASDIEADTTAEAPLAETVWLRECASLRTRLAEVEAERDEAREEAEDFRGVVRHSIQENVVPLLSADELVLPWETT